MDIGHDDPDYQDWMNRWMKLRLRLPAAGLPPEPTAGRGGETGQDNAILEHTFNRTGVSILGKRMSDGGEHNWPEEAPFHTPVFVLTHEVREPWKQPGGTTFYFVNDGIERTLKQAREAAGDRDIRISGGLM